MTPAKRTIGRPRIMTDGLWQIFFSRLVNGESLRQICRDEMMPCRETVYSLLRENPQFLDQYRQARELQLHYFTDRILEIADNVEPNIQAIQKARLQINALKWVAARQSRQEYGVQTGENAIKELTDDELRDQLFKIFQP